MFELAIILCSISTITLSAHLYRLASGEPVWRLNMLTYSFCILIVLSFVASVVIVLDVPFMGYNPNSSISSLYGDHYRHLAVWTIVMWMFIGIPAGAIFLNFCCGNRSFTKYMAQYRASTIQVGWAFNEHSLYYFVFILSSLFVLLSYYQLPETTALSNIISTGDVVGSQLIRRETTEGTGNVLFDSLFNQGTFQWLSYIAFAMAVITGRLKWRLLFVALFFVITFLAISLGSPSRLLYYLLGIGFVRSLLGKSFLKISEFAVVTATLVPMFIFFKGAAGNVFTVLWTSVATRIFFTQLFGTFMALSIFPDQHSFIGFGSTAKMIHELFNAPYLESYGFIMMWFYHPESVIAGYAGHLTTIFMGEAWANFGFIGILVAPLWVGAVVQLVNRMFVLRHKSAVAIAFYAYLTINFGYASDFISFYYPLGTFLFMLGAISLLILFRFLWSCLLVSSQRRDSEDLLSEKVVGVDNAT